MTVKQAIEELSKYPEDSKLYLDTGNVYEAFIGSSSDLDKDTPHVRVQYIEYNPQKVVNPKYKYSKTKFIE